MGCPPNPTARNAAGWSIGRGAGTADGGESLLSAAGCMTLCAKLIHRRWSPEQIARKLQAMHPEDPTHQISHETLYAAIYAQPRGGLKAEMLAALRQAKPARGLRRTTLSGGSIAPITLRIIHRPAEIEGRLVPGHWEGDLIKGAFNRSAVDTVVERKTRYLILSSSSVKQSIRGIDCSAERAAAPLTRRWTASVAR